jgi:hypothetical protein
VGPSLGDKAGDWSGKRVEESDTEAVGNDEAWGLLVVNLAEESAEGSNEGVWEPNDGAAVEKATDGVADDLNDGDKDSITATEGELEAKLVELGALVGIGVDAALGLSDGLLEGPVLGAKEDAVLGRRNEGIVDGLLEGPVVGLSDGLLEGPVLGAKDGAVLGRRNEGIVDGLLEGPAVGLSDGLLEGPVLGAKDGAMLGRRNEGIVDGLMEGPVVGLSDGLLEGPPVGAKDGVVLRRRNEGIVDGLLEGPVAGAKEGAILGRRDGGMLIPSTIIIDSMVSMKASNSSFSCSNSSSTLVWTVASS